MKTIKENNVNINTKREEMLQEINFFIKARQNRTEELQESNKRVRNVGSEEMPEITVDGIIASDLT